MLEKVKLALRISHGFLDSVYEGQIAEARADLIRLGISKDIAGADNIPLVTGCITTYVLFKNANKDDAERYWESYLYQADCLRKSSNLVEESVASNV